MAITTTTITKSVGWAKTDVILQLEEAFTWLGWHGGTRTGIITGISAYSGGGTVGSSQTDYYDVFPISTSGIGTGASFRVDRQNGSIGQILVNRPGYGYTNGEVVQLSAADIGGSANGATGIAVTVFVAGGASPISYGSTTTFYDKDVTSGATYPWGVLRHTIQQNKKFGDTYRIFQTASNTTFNIDVCSGFHPWNDDNLSDRGNGYGNRLVGNYYFDIVDTPVLGSGHRFNINNTNNFNYTQAYNITFANSSSYQLDLNIFRSGIDPRFAVLSFKHPTLSSTKLRDNTYFTFIAHNFTTNIWDLDYLFLSGLTEIVPSGTETNAYLEFRTHCVGNSYYSGVSGASKRAAEFGYIPWNGGAANSGYKSVFYQSTSNDDDYQSYYHGIYVRSDNTINQGQLSDSRAKGGYSGITDTLPSQTNYNAVIKGIPINAALIPCPYYMPDDFVLIDFDNEAPNANIQQGDTITISGSEVYTVIQGSYNQTNRTRGILFCARTV